MDFIIGFFQSPSVITTLFMILGWGVIIWNGTRLARRSEVRALCNSIQIMLERLQSSTRDAWKGRDSLDRVDEESLSLDINSLEKRIRLLSATCGDVNCSFQLARLRILVTRGGGGRYDEIQVRRWLSDIWSECTDIHETIEMAYLRTFNPGAARNF